MFFDKLEKHRKIHVHKIAQKKPLTLPFLWLGKLQRFIRNLDRQTYHLILPRLVSPRFDSLISLTLTLPLPLSHTYFRFTP